VIDSPDPIGDRLRAAMHHEAAGVPVDEEAALGAVRARGAAARRRRRTVLTGVGAAVAVVAVSLAVPRFGDDPDRTVIDSDPAATTTIEPDPPAPSTPPTSSPDTTPGTTGTDPAPGGTGPPAPTTVPPDREGLPGTTTDMPDDAAGPSSFTGPPLWPFRTAAEVEEWQAAYAAGGTQPWHHDAEMTASLFTTQFLGFTDVDQVLASDVDGDEAYVTVGYEAEPGSGNLSPAARIHLRRYGSGEEAPWEVVGTADTTLSLDTPSYGSTATSPLTVGGVITGVDESLRVQVRQPSSAAPLGESCCEPAGGESSPWQSTVTFTGATDPALTVVVSTGGHVQDVERFAITALRT